MDKKILDEEGDDGKGPIFQVIQRGDPAGDGVFIIRAHGEEVELTPLYAMLAARAIKRSLENASRIDGLIGKPVV